jgi:type 1 glutamine amidotransferase
MIPGRSAKGEERMSEEPLKLCMVSGSFEYESESSLTAFRDYVEREHPVRADLIVYRSEDDHQSLSAIEETDVLLVFTRRLNADGEELERFKAYCGAGKPIVGVRTASHAFQNWLAFDREVLGGNYQMHWRHGPRARVRFEPGSEGHSLLEGVAEFSSAGSLYRNTPIAPDTSLLMSASTDEHDEPVTWTRNHAGGRVFYTSLGHQEDFEEPSFLRLLANAVLWCGGRI